jgi:YD repeat-containing protein
VSSISSKIQDAPQKKIKAKVARMAGKAKRNRLGGAIVDAMASRGAWCGLATILCALLFVANAAAQPLTGWRTSSGNGAIDFGSEQDACVAQAVEDCGANDEREKFIARSFIYQDAGRKALGALCVRCGGTQFVARLCPQEAPNWDGKQCRCFYQGAGWLESAQTCVACPAGTTLVGGKCAVNPPENNGCPNCQTGNPINTATGVKYESSRVYGGAGIMPLDLTLAYNSKTVDDPFHSWPGTLGDRVTSINERALAHYAGGQGRPEFVSIRRPDGKTYAFHWPDPYGMESMYVANANIDAKLERIPRPGDYYTLEAWRYTDPAREEVEYYDQYGLLLSVTNRQGLRQVYGYADGAGKLFYGNGTQQPPGYWKPADYVVPECKPPAGWVYQLRSASVPGNVVTFDPFSGNLLCIADPFDRQFNFQYEERRIVKMADPAGQVYQFSYNGPSAMRWDNSPSLDYRLTKVTFPDGATRTYHYNEAAHVNGGGACGNLPGAGLVSALTGITDENGVRFATWEYDCQGRAVSSEHAGGVNKSTLSYAAGQTTVSEFSGNSTSQPGNVRTYAFSKILDSIRNTAITTPAGPPAPCHDCGDAAAKTYDANSNVASRTDWNGNKTCYAYDLARNLETRRVEGLAGSADCTSYLSGTPTLAAPARMVSTTWSADWRLPLQIAEPLKITTFTYGAASATNPGERGNVLTRSERATTDANGASGFSATLTGSPRTTTFTYHATGQVASVDGARTDVADTTTYTYYTSTDTDAGKRGNLASITNALGQTTQITAYNAHGQPLTIVDPNGLTTQITYDSRMRLTGRNLGGEVTSYEYDGVGQLTRVTLPDGSSLAYTYDAAHRQTGIADNLGNRLAYTLDLRGNRTKEEVFDPANALARTRSRVFNSLSRLTQEVGAQSQTTAYTYDNQGNLVATTDPLSRTTTNGYDAIHRLVSVTQPSPGSGQPTPVIGYGYNSQGRLTQVTDPRNLVTSYSVNGLGDATQQVSPDTGTTIRTYDVAGNLLTTTDARGKAATTTYDALNRLTSTVYNVTGTGAELKSVTYQYDQGANGIGRLTTVTETSVANTVLASVSYTYDQKGRLASETRTLAGNATPYTTSYTRDQSTGRLTAMTYPSGRVMAYTYDSAGRITQISTTAPAAQGGQTQVLVAGVTYQPFGGVRTLTLGNNRVVTRPYDQDGRMASYTLGGTAFSLVYDAADRITGILDTSNAANSNSYGYDNLDRLTQAVLPNTTYSYGYDLAGNRSQRGAGSAASTYVTDSASNRLSQVNGSLPRTFSYDAAGNTTGDGSNQFGYDTRGRMSQAVSGVGTTSYQVDTEGRRVRKTNANGSVGDTVYHYDTSGKLIAETLPNGTTRREYFYLLDLPIGVNVQ